MNAGREELAALLLAERDAAQQELAVLTPRQKQCLTLTAKGYTYQETAELMGVTWHATRSHMRQVVTRLDCNATEAIVIAVKAGLV